MLARNEQWTFVGQRLEVVSYFIYLGMTLSMQLSFNRMVIDQATKAKRVLISLLNSLYNLGQIPKEVFFKLFDRRVSHVLFYRSEIWGFTKRDPIEVVHIYAYKHYTCVGLRSCNAAVLGDGGRFPIQIKATKRVCKYWMKIFNMPDSPITLCQKKKKKKERYLMLKVVLTSMVRLIG